VRSLLENVEAAPAPPPVRTSWLSVCIVVVVAGCCVLTLSYIKSETIALPRTPSFSPRPIHHPNAEPLGARHKGR
jgi:hypothetical protein